MSIVSFETGGSFKNTESFLKSINKLTVLEMNILNGCGSDGVNALVGATPKDSGLAASSWGYEISVLKHGCSITWTNNDIENGFPVAIMLQYGYGTGTGGFVQGEDYINPAIKPVFDTIADKVWKAVISA